MKKIILWSLLGTLVAGMAIGAFLWWARPQVVQLDKTTKLTLLGVEYGKHHEFPDIKTAGRRAGSGPTSFDTTNDTLVVWVLQEKKGGQRFGWQALVYDRAETACVMSWSRNSRTLRQNMEIDGIQVDGFPRWDSKFLMRFTSWGQGGQRLTKDAFVISNPVRGKTFSKWTPDALPNTQSDGDLDVTLTTLTANSPFPYNRGTGMPKDDPAGKCVTIDFSVQQKGHSVTNWQPVQIVSSDAAGNQVTGWINQMREGNEPTKYFFQNGLWPGESAWKIRMEFSRTSGFNDNELWTVPDVPVKAGSWQDLWIYGRNGQTSSQTNSPFAETTLNGCHLKIFSIVRLSQNSGGPSGGGVCITTDPALPEGMRLTVTATDEQGHQLQNWGPNGGNGNYIFQFPDMRNAAKLNLAVALHQSRFVEFTVKPTKP